MPATTHTNSKIETEIKSLRHRNLLSISILVFFGLLILLIWGIVPAFNNMTNQQNKLSLEKQTLLNLENKQQVIKDSIDDPDFQSEATRVNNILYSENPFLVVLQTFNQLGAENNVSFDRFEYSPGLVATGSAQFRNTESRSEIATIRNAIQADGSYGFTIFLEASGTYAHLVDFLAALESYAPFTSVAYSEIGNNLLGRATGKFEILAHYYAPNIIDDLDKELPALNANDQRTLATLAKFNFPMTTTDNQIQLNQNQNDLFTLEDFTLAAPTETTEVPVTYFQLPGGGTPIQLN